jgi:hypothetical protein
LRVDLRELLLRVIHGQDESAEEVVHSEEDDLQIGKKIEDPDLRPRVDDHDGKQRVPVDPLAFVEG